MPRFQKHNRASFQTWCFAIVSTSLFLSRAIRAAWSSWNCLFSQDPTTQELCYPLVRTFAPTRLGRGRSWQLQHIRFDFCNTGYPCSRSDHSVIEAAIDPFYADADSRSKPISLKESGIPM
ncbi:hypothetical protein EJ04DRAFT_118022 [Polyplosphaeria fusca]|uniref:Uncharacterized protein n=1 Tax=Polyplosphaeria fusca TaxID=682080 RepID=A0A9P4R1G5_9PLEO|nr:hypothetical protein EJ04DRAFT_118022 [Polyplosphaeria fusca]